MRFTKTLNTIDVIKTQTGTDSMGRPVYSTTDVLTPFLGEVEPYSAGLAETKYGVFVAVTNRVFCYPNDKIKLGASVEYKGNKYTVTECMMYDKHYEVLIKKV